MTHHIEFTVVMHRHIAATYNAADNIFALDCADKTTSSFSALWYVRLWSAQNMDAMCTAHAAALQAGVPQNITVRYVAKVTIKGV